MQDKTLPVSFDVTVSSIQWYKMYEDVKSNPKFYYVWPVGFKNKIIPLLQACVLKYSVPIIEKFLNLWVECRMKVPK